MSNPEWNAMRQKSPVVAVDAVIQSKDQGVVFIQRRYPPFQGHWALPGGKVEIGETVEEAIIREVKEETGFDVKPFRLIGVFSDPARDPRGHMISIAYTVRIVSGSLQASDDALEAKIFFEAPENLAFDHQQILDASGAFQRGEDRKTGSVSE